MTIFGRLVVEDHNRAYAGMTYVYPVVSRRAGGVSVGINLNPNNACNWRCIYCQVPNLQRGGPPAIDLAQLGRELRQMLEDIVRGEFMLRFVAPEQRILQDIAFSGNGEPTSAKEFADVVSLVAAMLREFAIAQTVKIRLITNGSLLDRPRVQEGIQRLGCENGEVWFKCDAASPNVSLRINGSRQQPTATLRRLNACARLCPTWVQSCFFAYDGKPPAETDVQLWLDLLQRVTAPLQGVHLYGLARPSMQMEAQRLSRLPADWLELLAEQVRALGLTAKVSP